MACRQNARDNWLKNLFGNESFSCAKLAGDASFRTYYRLKTAEKNCILMDAPPEKEAVQPFINIANILKKQGILRPELLAVDEPQGFILLEDCGDTLLLDKLSLQTAPHLYKAAIQTLLQIQTCPEEALPSFDKAFMLQELGIFQQWFLQGLLKIALSPEEEELLHTTFESLSSEIEAQPKGFIHRDYHSRNIMLHPEKGLAVIDFQDAMRGPIPYDLVSLLKDCYIQWPASQVTEWLTYFYEGSAIAKTWSLPAFIRAFDLCGLQRHLKVLGVFSRLHLRDDKPHYLKHLPLTLHYVQNCLETYAEFQPFFKFMQERVQL